MKKENGYWIDENNNKWDCKDTDEELAIIYSRFMCNCDNCTNCNHLYACNDLEDCTVCKTVTFD